MASIPGLTRPKGPSVPRPPADSAVFKSIQGFVFRDKATGTDRPVGLGERLRASDSAVQQYPQFFVEDGATESEVSDAWTARFPNISQPRH